MNGHVFVVGADLTRLACDDVLVPTDRSLRVTSSWVPLLPPDAIERTGSEGACVAGSWSGAQRVREVPGCADERAWLVDTVDDGDPDGERSLDWLLDGAREALAAVAGREVTEPAHGRARRLVGLPALGSGWGGAAGRRGELLRQLLQVLRGAADEHGYDIALVLRRPSDLAAAQRVRRADGGGWALPEGLRDLAEELGRRARGGELAVFLGAGVSAAAGLASRPTGYLLDPAYRGLLDEEETALSAALADVAAAIGSGDSWASLEVLRLLRELGQTEGAR